MIPSIVSLHVLGPSITITKKLFKDRNYSHFPYEEAEIQKLRHLPKHVMKATWLRVTIAHFVKDGASFLPWHLGWLSFHSQVFYFEEYILWAPTFLVRVRQRTGKQICVTDSKTRVHYFKIIKFRKRVIIHSFSKHLLSTPHDRHCAERCN